MAKRHPERLWVDPEFHKMLKIESAMKDLSIIEYTKQVAEEEKKKSAEEKQRRRLFKFDGF